MQISQFKKHEVLISNFSYLSVLQLFQLLLPLITYPYLIRVLGKENYGVVVVSNAIISYLSVFINFGFEISETKQISVDRDNANKVSEIISTVFTIKIVFTFLAILGLLILLVVIPELNKHKSLYMASIAILLDVAVNPRFYFQGTEKMKFITYLTISSKLIFLILTFVVIKTPAHYILVPLLTGAGALLSSIVGVIIIFKEQGIHFVLPTIHKIKRMIQNSVPFFTSRLSVLAISKTNVILIGVFAGYAEVSYYDLAEKLVNVMKMPFNTLNQALFPNVSKTKNINLVKKTLRYLILIYILGYISLYIFGESLINLFGGSELLPARFVLYVLGLTAVTELLSVFLGAPILLVMGYKKEYNSSIIWGSLFYAILVLVLYLNSYIGLYTIATVAVAVSSFILIYRIVYCRKHELI